jgi:hypothetical protein
MASKIQFKRGTTTQSDAYRGAEGEVIINTTKDTIVVHDGVEAGGYEIIRSDLSNISGNVPAVNITDVDCGIYGSGLFAAGTFSSASLSQTIDNPNDYGTSASDQFGSYGIATSGNYTIVGARGEDTASDPSTGRAYIFNNSTGALVHTLDNPNAHGTGNSDEFGYSVAISGNYAAVGARGESSAASNTYASGKAYIFNVSTGSLLFTLSNPNDYGTALEDQFSAKMAMSGDYLIVGAWGEDYSGGNSTGKAYIFNVTTGALVHTIDNPDDAANAAFGYAVGISGNNAIVGAQGASSYSGKAYIFNVTSGALVHTLDNPNAYNAVSGDRFGFSVSIADNYALIGAVYEDDAGGNGSGKAYVFNVSTGALLQTLDNPNAYGTSADDNFGGSVAISGTTGIVGAYDENDAGGDSSGKAYIFNVTTGELLETLDNPSDYGTSASDSFGRTLAISSDYIVAGTFTEDDAGGTSSGKVYIYDVEMEQGDEIAAPGAPTIGTASVVDFETVTVAFTAPSDNGYATIETYTATSSPGGITGTLSQAGSGTITVTGLSGSTSYTFTVTATNSYTTGDPSSASNTVTTPAQPVATFLRTIDNPNDYGTSAGDYFGSVGGISDTYAILSARGEDDAGGNQSGKAYIFNNSTGALVHTLDNPNAYGTSAGDSFGQAAAISGNYAIVSANGEDDAGGTWSGKAYIFNVSTGALLHTLDNPNDYGTSAGDTFGDRVAISDTYSIVGAYAEDDAGGTQSGKAYIYNNSTGALVHTLDNPNDYDTSANDQFGSDVAISDTYAIVGASKEDDADGTESGKAYIFNVSTGALVHTLDNPNEYGTSQNDRFGWSVAISGNYAIVGAYGESDADGTYNSGKAYIYNVTTGALLQTLDNPNDYGTSTTDQFGYSVGISDTYAIVGAYSEREDDGSANGVIQSGKVYIFSVSTGALLETQNNPNAYGTSESDAFGRFVAITDDYALAGTYVEDDAGGSQSGKAYMYSL